MPASGSSCRALDRVRGDVGRRAAAGLEPVMPRRGGEQQQRLAEHVELELRVRAVARDVGAAGVAGQAERRLVGHGLAAGGVDRRDGVAVGQQPIAQERAPRRRAGRRRRRAPPRGRRSTGRASRRSGSRSCGPPRGRSGSDIVAAATIPPPAPSARAGRRTRGARPRGDGRARARGHARRHAASVAAQAASADRRRAASGPVASSSTRSWRSPSASSSSSRSAPSRSGRASPAPDQRNRASPSRPVQLPSPRALDGRRRRAPKSAREIERDAHTDRARSRLDAAQHARPAVRRPGRPAPRGTRRSPSSVTQRLRQIRRPARSSRPTRSDARA